jgi:hypothetical protein
LFCGGSIALWFGLLVVIMSGTGRVWHVVLLAVLELHRGTVACMAWESMDGGGGLMVVTIKLLQFEGC